MNSPSLAIDFGTTRTKVAYIDPKEGKPTIAEIGREVRSVIPSVFYLPVGSEPSILVGDDAQDMVETDPAGVVIKLKMEIHAEGPKNLGRDRPRINRAELAGRLFRWIRERCSEQVLYTDIRSCTITVPVSFQGQQRECIKRAAEWGGFKDIQLEEEPVAAATAWLNEVGETLTDLVMVCDVGGGTTDLALLEHTGKFIQPFAEVPTRGFDKLGGCQVDEAIWNRILQSATGNETSMEEKASKYLLRIRRLKETIRRFTTEKLPFGRKSVIPRGVVESAIRKIVEDIVDAVRSFHDSARKVVGNRKIPLLLVGGGAGLQGLKESLEMAVSGQVYLWSRSEYATALGAASIQQQSRRTLAPGSVKLHSKNPLPHSQPKDGRRPGPIRIEDSNRGAFVLPCILSSSRSRLIRLEGGHKAEKESKATPRPTTAEHNATMHRAIVEAELVVLNGPASGQVVAISAGYEVSIGRTMDANSVFISDSYMSRQHFLVGVADDEVWLEDRGSSHGTFWNDQKIECRIALENGDRIRAGSTDFVVRLREPVSETLETSSTRQTAKPTVVAAKLPSQPPEPQPGAESVEEPSDFDLDSEVQEVQVDRVKLNEIDGTEAGCLRNSPVQTSPTANWYISKDGRSAIGPYSAEEIRQLARDGELIPTDLISREGSNKWVSADRFKELFEHQTLVPLAGESRGKGAQWLIARGQQEPIGPYSIEELKQFAANDFLKPADLIWQKGMPEWVVAASVSELSFTASTKKRRQEPRAADYVPLLHQLARDRADCPVFLRELVLVIVRHNPANVAVFRLHEYIGQIGRKTPNDRIANIVGQALQECDLSNSAESIRNLTDILATMGENLVTSFRRSLDGCLPQWNQYLGRHPWLSSTEAQGRLYADRVRHAFSLHADQISFIQSHYQQLVESYPRYKEIMTSTGVWGFVGSFAAGFLFGELGAAGAEAWGDWKTKSNQEFVQSFSNAVDQFTQFSVAYTQQLEADISPVLDLLAQELDEVYARVIEGLELAAKAGIAIDHVVSSLHFPEEKVTDEDGRRLAEIVFENLRAVGLTRDAEQNLREMNGLPG